MREDKFTKQLEQEYRQKIEKWRHRIKRTEDFETVDGVMDLATATTMFSFFDKEITEIIGILSTGKESTIYLARNEQKYIAIKSFRTKTLDFKKARQYLDARQTRIPKKSHKFIELWAEKEYKNLYRNYRAGVRVPRPIAVKRNVLLMDFIGENEQPAPQLRHIRFEAPQEVFDDLIIQIKRMYHEAKLVHADLSEYNVLYHEDPWIIDCSQSISIDHPIAKQFLYRDLENVFSFFEIKGAEVPEVAQFYEELTGAPLDPLTVAYFD